MWREFVQEFHGKYGGISRITTICGGSLFRNSTRHLVESLGSPLYVAGACSGIPREISRITSICGGSLFRNSTGNL